MRILLFGWRQWGDWHAVEQVIRALPLGAEVAHGDARGWDTMCHYLLANRRSRVQRARHIRVHSAQTDRIGTRRGEGRRQGDVDVHVYPADWDLHRFDPEGRERRPNPAGFMRNEFMLTNFAPDIGVYGCDDLGRCGGTRDMARRLERADLVVYEWRDYVQLMRDGGLE